MQGLLNLGYYNYVTINNVIAIIDYKTNAGRRLIRTAKSDKPRSVLDVTKGRAASSIIICTGDRYILSALSRIQLANRLSSAVSDDNDIEDVVEAIDKKNQARERKNTKSGNDIGTEEKS